MKIVCILDLDETLGFFDDYTFHVRPNVNFLINFLRVANIDIVLWSLGSDHYVKSILNGFLPDICKYATKVFARTVCIKSNDTCGIPKCSDFIRKIYNEEIILIGVDDRVNEVMDNRYDFRILVQNYNSQNLQDKELISVIEKITHFLVSLS